MRRMCPSVVSSPTFVVWTSIAPTSLSVPAYTMSPTCFSTARLSPVIAAWLTEAIPNATMPSTGIRSPERISTRSPLCTSSNETTRSCPSRRTVTRSGSSFASESSAFPARAETNSSIIPPNNRSTATTAAAEYWPMISAPAVANETGISAVKSRSRMPWKADHQI